jgi:hypothetical protein
MGTTLTGTTPQDTYDSLIKVTDNGPLTGSLKKLTDGLGNDSSLSLSTTAASLSGTLAVSGDVSIADKIVHIGDTNTAIRFPANDTITFETDAAERMRITSAGIVGIGVTPSAWGTNDKAIELGGSNSSTYTGLNVTSLAKNCYYDGTNWVYEQSTVTSLLYQQSFTGNHIFYTAPTGTAGAAITFTESVRIDSNGIKFNGDTAAANALDDYEEGTWTPVILGDTGGVVTLVTQFGKYTKIGNMVTLNGYVSWSVNTGTGQARLTGLPFAINNTTTPIANQVAIHEQNGGVAQGVHFRFDGTAAAAQGYSYNFDGTAATCLSFGATGYIGINATYFV